MNRNDILLIHGTNYKEMTKHLLANQRFAETHCLKAKSRRPFFSF